MKPRLLFPVLTSLLIFASCRQEPQEHKPLLCYVGGTMRPAMEAIAKRYQAQTGQQIAIDYAESGELLIKIEQTKRGDIFVCHAPFGAATRQKGLARHSWTVATVEPVIVVPKGNPKKIHGLRDLAKPGLRLVLPDAEYSTTGHMVSRMIAKHGLQGINSNIVSRVRGGGAAANAVILGTADAAIVWNAVAHLRQEKLDTVQIEDKIKLKPGIDAVTSPTYGPIDMGTINVTLATLTASKQPAAAKAFAEFAASTQNRKVWQSFGFNLPATPAIKTTANLQHEKILVHCAAGMRLPVSKLAKMFEQQTGCKVALSYDGSNRLLGQIKLSHKGDLYVAGDTDYIKMATQAGLTDQTNTICYFVPVIMVQKGNPKNIHALKDVASPGIRIGQGDEKAAAVGRLLPKLRELNGVPEKAWQKNVVMSSPTVNEPAMAIKLGTVDAAVVWDAIAAKYTNAADIVSITNNITPAVGVAVLSFSKHKTAANEFMKFITSKSGKEILKQNGYTVTPPLQKEAL